MTLKTKRIGSLGFLFLLGGLLCEPRAAIGKEATSPGPNIHLRGNFLNSHYAFSAEKKGHVAFIGVAFTEMRGYRPMLYNFLQKRFPETKFTFTNAGIASTCSTTGAFRLRRDVLSKGPVDLIFIEYAVNDELDAGHARRVTVGMIEEGQVALVHSVAYEVACLVIPYATPVAGSFRSHLQVVEARFVGLALDEPVIRVFGHAASVYRSRSISASILGHARAA